MAEILMRPTTTNVRHQEPDNVYHIYNRIAHSVRFLEDAEKDDLLDRITRISEFSGIQLLAWCLMTNHFHILVYLPEPRELSKDEIKRRLECLRPEERAVFVDGFVLDRAPREITKRMFNIGMMMKIIKENFTISYNERTGHHGTMWEGPYRYKKVPMTVHDMMTVAAYQNLNPVRARMVGNYTDYVWTSFAAATKGDQRALRGIQFMLGGFKDRTNLSDRLVRPAEDLLGQMREKMDCDLADFKYEIAEDIWRKRLVGGVSKSDPLTSEAMMAQVEMRMSKLMANDFHDELAKVLGRRARQEELAVIRAMAADPEAKTSQIARIAGISPSGVKRISLILQKIGIISREGTKRCGVWRVKAPQTVAA